MVPWILCGIFIIIILALIAKIRLLQKSIDEVCAEFKEQLSMDTNTLISVPSRDPHVRKLASEINVQLRLLQKDRRRFQSGDRELKSAVTNISHDLRTPLTAICGYLDLAEQEEKTPNLERYLSIIQNRTKTLKQLTEELLQYSVSAFPEQELQIKDVVLNELLENSILEFYAVLQERGITPNISITEQKILRKGNPSALSRVFSNILSNALKYSDGDLRVTLADDGVICFSNSASRLSEVQAEKLFDRFFTLEDARKSTGLGLSIAKTLTEQMGGRITAKYVENRLEIRVCLMPNLSIDFEEKYANI